MRLSFRQRFLQMKIKLPALIALLLFAFAVNTQTVKSTQLITLNGPWKFKTGDDIKWTSPDHNDADWEAVDLTAPPGAHDGDVGLSGYIPGWTAKGHPAYAGYAWYRLKILSDSLQGNELALTGPPAVDDAYQLFINGILSGSGGGDFSRSTPVIYSIQPRMFLLPENAKKEKWITIAFRVWMSAATLTQGTDLGGIHIAPVLGDKKAVASVYQFQWGQTIKGYIVEVIEPLLFILLAITMFFSYKRNKQNRSCKWFIIALILLGLVRANQAVFYWFQVEDAHTFDIITTVTLRPLILGSWLMAWREWYQLGQLSWLSKTIAVLTLVYIVAQLLALPWFPVSAAHTTFQSIADYTRLLFIALLLLIVYLGMRKSGRKEWIDLFALLLVSIGLFAQEISALHIQGIWFPFGVGVSRGQFAYAAFVVVMFMILLRRKQKTVPG